jgi:anti-anti-sigma factor
MKEAKFTYPTELASEGRMYDDVKSFLSQIGWDARKLHGAILAISESFNNAMIHGNSWDPDKQVHVYLAVKKGYVTADIIDEGTGDIKYLKKRKPSDLHAEGGRGIDLIETFSDKVQMQHCKQIGGVKVSLGFEYNERESIPIANNTEENMDYPKREENGVMVIELTGRLDLTSGNALKDGVKELLTGGKASIHLNLKEVEFVNSSGLGALVSIMKEIRLHRGRLTLSDLADYVREIFDITQLSHIFEIFATESEALNSYQVPVSN